MSTTRHWVLSVAAAAFLLVGCGGGESGSTSQSSESLGQGAPQGQQAPGGQSGQGQQAPSGQLPGQSPQGDVSQQVSQAQMEAAGRVFVALQEAQEEMEMEGGQPSQEAQQKLSQAMMDAISQEDDLTANQFKMIMMGAQQNQELRQRFFQAIDEAGGSVPAPPPSGQSQPGGPGQ